jgi:hypothetical protein
VERLVASRQLVADAHERLLERHVDDPRDEDREREGDQRPERRKPVSRPFESTTPTIASVITTPSISFSGALTSSPASGREDEEHRHAVAADRAPDFAVAHVGDEDEDHRDGAHAVERRELPLLLVGGVAGLH